MFSGGTMKFFAKGSVDGDWLPLGSWFTTFIDLGEKIHSARHSGLDVRKILISVPVSDMISLALAIGFSRAAYVSQVSKASRVDLTDLKVGKTVQLRSVWNEKDGKVTPPANFVGVLEAVERTSNAESPVTLRFGFNNGTFLNRNISPRSAPPGMSSPKDFIRFFEVPENMPHKRGDSDLSVRRVRTRKISRPKLKQDEVRRWFMRFEEWEYQVNPTLAVFGPATDIREYGQLLFRDEDLHGSILNIDHDEILDAARLDNLSNDEKPHFVNVIDQVARFPEPGTAQRATFEMFPFVCLDGNTAISSLSQKGILRSKCVIALMETSKPNLQNIALETFLETASQHTSIDDFEKQLGWQAPPGIQCWGWS